MKKFLIAVLSLLVCFTTIGCSCAKKITLEDNQYTQKNNGTVEYLSSFDPIQEKIDNKLNFVLFIYADGCTNCDAFKKVLAEYTQDNDLRIYAVEVRKVASANPALKATIKVPPAIVIYKEGKLYQSLLSEQEGQAEYFLTKEGFGQWLEKYVILK